MTKQLQENYCKIVQKMTILSPNLAKSDHPWGQYFNQKSQFSNSFCDQNISNCIYVIYVQNKRS